MSVLSTYLLLALCLSGASGFAGVGQKPMSRRVALQSHRTYGPDQSSGNDFMSLIRNHGCTCIKDSNHSVSPRIARIEIPFLMASTAFVRPAIADDDAEVPGTVEINAGILTTTEEQPQSESGTVETESMEGEQTNTSPASEPPPTTQKTFEDSLQTYFPKALLTSVVVNKVQNALSQRKFNLDNTLMACCTCPDEINNKKEGLAASLQNAMTDNNRGVYQLGGLAGLPYLGASGMKAFLSHTPLSGKVFILFGPHIGITKSGYVGRVERPGQEEPTLDCDTTLHALTTALYERKRAKAEGEVMQSSLDSATTAMIGPSDKREQYVVAKLRSALDSSDASGLKKEDLPAFATYQMFDLVKEKILKQLQACLKDDGSGGNVRWDGNVDEIVLLGGIIINRGQEQDSIDPHEDYFLPLVFESYSNSGSLADVKDLFQPNFGAKPSPFYRS